MWEGSRECHPAQESLTHGSLKAVMVGSGEALLSAFESPAEGRREEAALQSDVEGSGVRG